MPPPNDSLATRPPPNDETDPLTADPGAEQTGDLDSAESKPKEKLNLQVQINRKSACERHITVSVSPEDIRRYFDEKFTELMPNAAVPGFRQGRAPRKLVEARFRKDVTDQVKGALIMDSLEQVSEESKLAPISEPDFDPTAVELPEEGAMTFEFNLEVRPEFDLPEWKGLSLERPTREISDADVDQQLRRLLEQRGQLEPFDGPAEPGDFLVLNLKFVLGEQQLSHAEEEVIRIRPVLSFRDGKIEKFDKLMNGVRAGETRRTTAKLSSDAPKEELRGKEVQATFEVLEVKKLVLPELTPALLSELGAFDSEEALREAVRESLKRRLTYSQQQRVREQITRALTVGADWDLPPDLLRRQAGREFERSILELRRSGFGEGEIRAYGNDLRQNSLARTARALKEHFILERIAESENVEDAPDDYETEIQLIAMQSEQSVRRVRAQLQKRGLMDTLRNQIIERKVIELIMSHAKYKDVSFEFDAPQTEALDRSAGGGDEPQHEIPEAKHAGEPESLRQQEEHA